MLVQSRQSSDRHTIAWIWVLLAGPVLGAAFGMSWNDREPPDPAKQTPERGASNDETVDRTVPDEASAKPRPEDPDRTQPALYEQKILGK